MNLIYVDESGINYKKEGDKFIDSPFVYYGAIAIEEFKYLHLERLFIDIIKEFFDIRDWRKVEVHATDIWCLKGQFSTLTRQKSSLFFEEIIQLLAKLSIPTIVGFSKKTTRENRRNEIINAMYAMLHGIEKRLSDTNQAGVIISDKSDLKSEDGLPLLSRLLEERMEWRFGILGEKTTKTKYKYESMSCFILDNIHYVDSSRSLFSQIIDIVLYVLMRVVYFTFLLKAGTEQPLLELVPISPSTFNYFSANNLMMATYSETTDDILFATPSDFRRYDNSLQFNIGHLI